MNSKIFILHSLLLVLFSLLAGVASAQQEWERPVWPMDTPRPVTPPEVDSITEALQKRPVVRAVVEEHETNIGGRVISRVRIEYVYSGPQELVGHVFKDISVGSDFQGGRGGSYYLAAPTLTVGETGIWMLVPWEDTWFRERGQVLATWWPARPNVRPPLGPNYESVRQLAEAFETVWQGETEEERIELLKEFGLSQTPEVSVGAIRLLEEVVPHEFQKFVSKANLLNLPLRAQITIDEIMIKSQRDEWRDSDARLQLIQSWRTRTIVDGDDTSLILQRLSNAIQQRIIDPETLFEILQPIVTSQLRMVVKGEPHPIDDRLVAASIMRYIVNESAVRDDVFALLTSVLESEEDNRLQRVSAESLQFVATLEEKQLERLIRLRDYYAELADETEDPRAPVKRIAALLHETVQKVKVREQ